MDSKSLCKSYSLHNYNIGTSKSLQFQNFVLESFCHIADCVPFASDNWCVKWSPGVPNFETTVISTFAQRTWYTEQMLI